MCGPRNPLAVYAGLKVVCAGYLVPVVYLLVWYHFSGSFYFVSDETGRSYKMLMLTGRTASVLSVLGILWLCLFLIQFSRQMIKYLRWSWFLKKERKEQDEDVLQKLSECRRRLAMKRVPEVYRKVGLNTPLCTGLFSKTIQLPERQYRSEELDVIFMHELTHIRKHDLEMKWISVLILLIHCFNPMVYFLFREISVWSEIRCDIVACEKGREAFSIKKYYSAILGMMQQGENYNGKDVVLTALMEKDTDITRRIRFVKNYRKTEVPLRFMSAAAMAAILFMALAVSYVYGKGIMDYYEHFTQEDFSMEMEEIVPMEENHVENVDEIWKFSERKETNTDADKSYGNLDDLKMKSGRAYQTEEIYCEPGTEIMVNCMLSNDSGRMVVAGIISEDRSARFVSDKNCVGYRFSITEGGNYRIFSGNSNADEVTVNVNYYRRME